MIEAFNLDRASQQIQGIQLDDQNTLQQGLSLLNQQKWQQAYELISQNIKYQQKQLSFSKFFQSISLVEMNKLDEGIILREEAKKINDNLYKDLLDYSDLELKKNPKNALILIAKMLCIK